MEKWKNTAIKINKENWTDRQLAVPVRATHWANVRMEREYFKIGPVDGRFLQKVLIPGKISRKEEHIGTCWILPELWTSACSKYQAMYLYPGEKCFEHFPNRVDRKIEFKNKHFFT